MLEAEKLFESPRALVVDSQTAEEQERKSPLHPPESGAPFNPVEEVIYRRRSVRVYKKKQVPEYLIRRIIEAGRFAPSGGNGQPWKFVVVRDSNLIREMTDDVVKFLRRLMWLVDYTKPGMGFKSWLARIFQWFDPNSFHPIPFGGMKMIAEGQLGVWHGAPTVILLLADMRCPGQPILDVGIAGENMVLTAHSYGLGTCWVSFCTPLSYQWKWRKKFGLRHPYRLVTSIAIGYPRGAPDGAIERETKAIDWFDEGGGFRVVY